MMPLHGPRTCWPPFYAPITPCARCEALSLSHACRFPCQSGTRAGVFDLSRTAAARTVRLATRPCMVHTGAARCTRFPRDLLCFSGVVSFHVHLFVAQGESMCPVCLPRLNPGAFLHAYVAFLHPPSGIAVALLSAVPDSFGPLSAGRHSLEADLEQSGVIQVKHP